MTIEELRNYRHIKAKLIAIDAEIESSYNTVASIAPKEVIPGVSNVRTPNDPTAKAFDRRECLRAQQAILQAEAERIETWVDNVEDIMVGAVIQLHFIAGLSWRQTSIMLNKYGDGDSCRMMVKRYFENI